jgi:hypothetical protein
VAAYLFISLNHESRIVCFEQCQQGKVFIFRAESEYIGHFTLRVANLGAVGGVVASEDDPTSLTQPQHKPSIRRFEGTFWAHISFLVHRIMSKAATLSGHTVGKGVHHESTQKKS